MNLRLIAASILLKVINKSQSLTKALEQTLDSIEDSKNKAFIQALCFGVTRQYHRLDFILQQLLTKPLRNKDKDIEMLLLIGLYQLNYMRVKSHAAVCETVSAAKKKNWAKSLINGVLRQYIRDQDSLENKANDNISAVNSHPEWLINIIEKDWPDQAANILLNNNLQAPMVLRVNLARISRDAYLRLLAEQTIAATTLPFCSSTLILNQAIAVEKLPGFSQGLVSVQDTAAQLVAELIDIQAGHSVLDICAAPGGKTAAILETQSDSVSMLAVDINEERLNMVKDNLQRLRLNAKLVVGDATHPDLWVQGQIFDRIIVDVPCSAIGVIRRHPDIKILRKESDIPSLQVIQKKILNASWKLLAPGGIMLYATCSILKQENEMQIASFLKNHIDASEIIIKADWGDKRKFGRQVLTGNFDMDGFYYAKLVKNQ